MGILTCIDGWGYADVLFLSNDTQLSWKAAIFQHLFPRWVHPPRSWTSYGVSDMRCREQLTHIKTKMWHGLRVALKWWSCQPSSSPAEREVIKWEKKRQERDTWLRGENKRLTSRFRSSVLFFSSHLFPDLEIVSIVSCTLGFLFHVLGCHTRRAYFKSSNVLWRQQIGESLLAHFCHSLSSLTVFASRPLPLCICLILFPPLIVWLTFSQRVLHRFLTQISSTARHSRPAAIRAGRQFEEAVRILYLAIMTLFFLSCHPSLFTCSPLPTVVNKNSLFVHWVFISS